MTKLSVSLGNRSYPITIGSGLLSQVTQYWPLKEKDSVFIITNETVAPLYLHTLTEQLSQITSSIHTFSLPDGERYKSIEMLERIYTELLSKTQGRDATLIALGGGVIGDIVGFAAATYLRGVRFIQIPTTLLAQVDSSVGGKTAVNHPLGKNMIGAFYQPASVIIDIDTLTTLPARELSAGLAEAIKYGIIIDADFFCWLEANIDRLLNKEPTALEYCIQRCCEIKAEVVSLDEKEQGIRTLLNLGHTYGHAIEAELGYGVWLHGEAVSAGMVMAAETALQLGSLTSSEVERIKALLIRANLPITAPKEIETNAYFPHMQRDKKTLNGEIRLVLPAAIGKAEIINSIPLTLLSEVIEHCKHPN